jgi:hypothetical protein
MKLELGTVTNNLVPGKIFLSLPDTEQTVVAGTFNATVLVAGATTMQTMESPTTPAPNSSSAAFNQRYGIRR